MAQDQSFGSRRPSGPRNNDTWKRRLDIKITLSNIPPGTTTYDVYKHLRAFGYIVRIEVLQIHRKALVLFSPPPNTAFWLNQYPFRNTPFSRVRPYYNEYYAKTFMHTSPVDALITYTEKTVLTATSIDFGLLTDDKSMMVKKTLHSDQNQPKELSIVATLNLQRREMDVQFPIKLEAKDKTASLQQFRFQLPFSQLECIHENWLSPQKLVLTIPVDHPTPFFRRIHDVESTHSPGIHVWNEWQVWYRQTAILHYHDRMLLSKRPIAFRSEKGIIDMGKWTTYRLVFEDELSCKSYAQTVRPALQDYNVKIVKGCEISILPSEEPVVFKLLENSHLLESATSMFHQMMSTVSLSFDVRYQLEVCISQGYIQHQNIQEDFVHKLAGLEPRRARALLETVADTKRRFYRPMEIFDMAAVHGIGAFASSIRHCRIQSITVTPTTIYVNPPSVETSNRITRRYIQHIDRFLRVRFTDERCEGKINSQDGQKMDEIFSRIFQTLKHGIIVADRYYEFLAFGNSQLREHSAYFFAPTADLRPADMRQRMGEFSKIKSIAKNAARLGQCFSTTRAFNSTKVKVVEVPDVERNGFCFTDGVGKISRFLAQMIADEWGLPNPTDDPPSLFQFRLGGCKGVIALAPDAQARDVHIRKSQYKFPAPAGDLEIIRISTFTSAYLNRQLIIILSTLGVLDQVFVNKQQDLLSELTRAMSDPIKAMELLQKNIDINQMTLVLVRMITDGFMDAKEPFMTSVLDLWRSSTIKYLKEKAKIFVEDGAFVFGCVDESAILRGHFNDPQCCHDATDEAKMATLPEVFLQVSDVNEPSKYRIIDQICLLARNPSLHPGDIRMVRAVNRKELHHHRNVVVLPQTGDRPVANMCSGGDLDGDDYIVIWDKSLFPKFINHPPMDFTPPEPLTVEGEVTTDHIKAFFVNYMKNDALGRIATAHLANADLSDEGVMDEKCLRLAELHSHAVDYPKSGVPAKMDFTLRPKKYPHFLSNRNRRPEKIYKSTKVLGQLFDQVKHVDFVPSYDRPFDERILQAYKHSDATLQQAREIKEGYDTAIRRIMAQHGIRTEFEVWSTFVIEHNQESKDYSFGEEIGRISHAVKQQFQNSCIEVAGGKDFEQLGPFVAAMYTLTAHEMTQALQMSNDKPMTMPLMSFPWIFVEVLGKIAMMTDVAEEYKTFAVDSVKPADHPVKLKADSVDVGKESALDMLESSEGEVIIADSTCRAVKAVNDGTNPIEAGEEPIMVLEGPPAVSKGLEKVSEDDPDIHPVRWDQVKKSLDKQEDNEVHSGHEVESEEVVGLLDQLAGLMD